MTKRNRVPEENLWIGFVGVIVARPNWSGPFELRPIAVKLVVNTAPCRRNFGWFSQGRVSCFAPRVRQVKVILLPRPTADFAIGQLKPFVNVN